MKCPLCEKDYADYGWFKKHMIEKHQWREKDCETYWDYHCPFCGASIPRHIKGCWNCGSSLDPHLVDLYNRKS